MARKTVHWRSKPQANDFAAAAAYLGLILTERQAASLVAKFKRTKTIRQLPKDIERASGLGLLLRPAAGTSARWRECTPRC
jgi:hypothetical protein